MKTFESFVSDLSKDKYHYIGNCINGLDDESFTNRVCSDATEMQQLVDNAKHVSKDFFVSNSLIPYFLKQDLIEQPNNFEFVYSEDKDVLVAYNEEKDIHYFFVK